MLSNKVFNIGELLVALLWVSSSVGMVADCAMVKIVIGGLLSLIVASNECSLVRQSNLLLLNFDCLFDSLTGDCIYTLFTIKVRVTPVSQTRCVYVTLL